MGIRYLKKPVIEHPSNLNPSAKAVRLGLSLGKRDLFIFPERITMVTAYAIAATVVLAAMTCVFLLALVLKDNSIVDIAYGMVFTAAAWVLTAGLGSAHPRQALLLFMVTAWGLRLAIHLFVRKRGKGEDFRYRAWREQWGRTFIVRSYFQIYILQGLVILIVASPVIAGITRPGGPLGILDLAGAAVWFTGLYFEAVGDWQLMRFKADPMNRGRIITTGLWRYTRHPNYFGEALLWWGFYIVALGSPGAWWTIISPLTIDFLLLKVSGIPMLEKRYKGNPEFEDYKKRTSPLIPWFPK
jgi:steroid 5-alpha reductase family enzyme